MALDKDVTNLYSSYKGLPNRVKIAYHRSLTSEQANILDDLCNNITDYQGYRTSKGVSIAGALVSIAVAGFGGVNLIENLRPDTLDYLTTFTGSLSGIGAVGGPLAAYGFFKLSSVFKNKMSELQERVNSLSDKYLDLPQLPTWGEGDIKIRYLNLQDDA